MIGSVGGIASQLSSIYQASQASHGAGAQAAAGATDSDGDHDGSPPGEVSDAGKGALNTVA